MSTTTGKAGWGKPKYGSSNTGAKTGSPKEGDNFIRILPPIHSLAEAGKWCIYETTHWGWFGDNPADPSKPFSRPFRCVKQEDRRTKMVTVPCAACEQFDAAQDAYDAEEAKLKAEGVAEDEIETRLASQAEWLKAHRPERKWYVNVMYKDGTFGNYKLNHKFHMAQLREFLEGEKSLQEQEGIDPLDLDQGVWFNVRRKGKKLNVVDTIEVEKEEIPGGINGRKAFQSKLAPLTAEQADQALRECVDLTTLGGLVVSPEQVQQLVECSGDPKEVDAILGIAVKGKSAPATTAPRTQAPATNTAAPKPQSTPIPTTVAPPATAKTVATQGAVTDAMRKRFEEIQARKAEEARQAAEAAAAAAAEEARQAAEAQAAASDTPSEPDPANMSEEEFLAFFEAKGGAPA